MALSTLILKAGSVSTSRQNLAYSPSRTDPKKAAIITMMRFTNVDTITHHLSAWFQKRDPIRMQGKFGMENMPNAPRQILPYNFPIAARCTLIEDAELTLDWGDEIYFESDGLIEFVLSGVERDVS